MPRFIERGKNFILQASVYYSIYFRNIHTKKLNFYYIKVHKLMLPSLKMSYTFTRVKLHVQEMKLILQPKDILQ